MTIRVGLEHLNSIFLFETGISNLGLLQDCFHKFQEITPLGEDHSLEARFAAFQPK